MNILTWIRKALSIEPQELPLVGRLWGHAFSVGTTRLFTSAAAKALFLSKYPPEYLAYVYLGVAVFVPLVGVMYLQLKKRIPFRTLLPLSFGFIFCIEVLFRLILVIPEWDFPALAIMVWFEIEFMLSGLAFWSLCNQLLDVRQGKRLFGLIGSGEVLAIVIAGTSTRYLAPLLGSLNLLFLSIAGTAVSFLFNFTIASQWMKEEKKVVQETNNSSNKPNSNSTSDPSYLQGIFLLALFSLLGYYFVDNMFQKQARSQYPNPEDLAIFFGQFLAFAGGMSFVLRMFLVAPLLNRYGLNLGLLAPPLLVLGATAFLLFSWYIGASPYLIFSLAVTLRILDKLGRDTLQKPSLLILYQPLPDSDRQNVQAKVESIIEPISAGLAGIILIALNTFFPDYKWISLVLLFFVLGIWIYVAYPLPKKYRTLLEKALTRRRITDSNLSLQDGLTLDLIKKGLKSSHAGEIIYSFQLLESADISLLESTLKSFISHSIPEVRLDCLKRIDRLKLLDLLSSVKENLNTETHPTIKGYSIRLLSLFDSTEPLSFYRNYLIDSEGEVRQGALIGLLLREGFPSESGEVLQKWVHSHEFIDRKIAVQVIGEVNLPKANLLLISLLEDSNNVIRKMSITIAGRLKETDLWLPLLFNLNIPKMRKTTILAISHMGDTILPRLEDHFNISDQTTDVKIAILDIYGRLGSEDTIHILKQKMKVLDKNILHQVLRSLKRVNYIGSIEELPFLKELVYREVHNSAFLLGILRDFKNIEGIKLLQRSLEFEISLHKERIFILLGFIYPVQGISLAREHLSGIVGGKKSYAIELLDQIVEVQMKSWILPLLESSDPTTCLERLGGEFDQIQASLKDRLEQIAKSDTSVLSLWTKASAIYIMGTLQIPELLLKIDSQILNLDPFLSETFLQAKERINQTQKESINYPNTILTIDRVLILKNVNTFSHIPDEFLSGVAAFLDVVRIKKGDKIFEKGDLGQSLYIVVEGSVLLHNDDISLGKLGKSEVFGEWAALDPEPRAASATAIEECILFKLENDSLYELMSSNIEIVRGVLQILCQNLRTVTKQL
jgi:ATP:ADP antiporter, AAA family